LLLLTLTLLGCSKTQSPTNGSVSPTVATDGTPTPGTKTDESQPPTGAPATGTQPVASNQAYLLRYDFATVPTLKYKVLTSLFVTNGNEKYPNFEKREAKATVTILQKTSKTSKGDYSATVAYQDVTGDVLVGGRKDTNQTASFLDGIRGRKDDYLFNTRGVLDPSGEAKDLDVGFGGIVFPEKTVKVGESWDYSTVINFGAMIGGDAVPVPVMAKYTLKEAKNGKGHIVMVVDAPINQDSKSSGAHFDGKLKLTVDGWVDLKTGIADIATSTLDINVVGTKTGQLNTYVRTASETRKRL